MYHLNFVAWKIIAIIHDFAQNVLPCYFAY